MKRCSACNMLCEDYAIVCSRCGQRFAADEKREAREYQSGQPEQRRAFSYTSENMFNHTGEFSPQEISREKPLAMLVYLGGILGIGFGLLKSDSKYIQFHVRQALKYKILTMLVRFLFLPLLLLFMTIGGAMQQMDGVSIVFLVFIILYFMYALMMFVFKIISFVWVCQGKAVEALLVRHIGFMR